MPNRNNRPVRQREVRPKMTGEYCDNCNKELNEVELAYGNLCNKCQREANILAKSVLQPLASKKKLPKDIDDIID